jgi:invasion protein IalB
MFISTRPADKVKDEVSVILGYPAKANVDAMAEIGATHVTMYTQKDGAWVKNTADEAKMVAALRSGSDVVVKSESAKNKITDTYSLKGLSQALDRVGQECK